MVQFFKCPSCDGLYQVVRAEAGPETRDGELACRVCGAPLAPRDGEFVLKYFLLRKAESPTGVAKASFHCSRRESSRHLIHARRGRAHRRQHRQATGSLRAPADAPQGCRKPARGHRPKS